MIDDRTVRLSQVLRAEGDSLLWLYDMGEAWNYTIEVTAVHEEPLWRVVVLDAACPVDPFKSIAPETYVCPPEDAIPDDPPIYTHDGVDGW